MTGKSNKYILLVDDEPDFLEALSIIVEAKSNHAVVAVKSGNEAITRMKSDPNIALIVSDFRMANGNGAEVYKSWKELNLACPIVICSGSTPQEVHSEIPELKHLVEKPNVIEPLTKFLEGLDNQASEEKYVPIRLSVWLRIESMPTDVYIKLSASNYVKIVSKGDMFTAMDAKKYLDKKVTSLYFKAAELPNFMKAFSSQLEVVDDGKTSDQDLMARIEESYEATSSLYQAFGWNAELKTVVDKSYKNAVKIIGKNSKLMELLEKVDKSPDRYLVAHGHFICSLSCALAKTLGWESDYTYTKLALASLIHDLTIPAELEEAIVSGTVALEGAYLNHPAQAADLLKEMENPPPDVDQIILQHHERPNATGFPAKLPGMRISPLAAVFIVAQDLTKYVWGKPDFKLATAQFLKDSKDTYSTGHFRKIFDALYKNFNTG